MISALHCWEIVCLCEMSWTCYKKSCLLGHFVYETVCLLSGQFVSTYNICFATRVAWWKGNIFVTVLNVMNNISTKICRSFLSAIMNVTLSKSPQCPRESCESWSRCPCCWPPGMWLLEAGPRDPESGDTPARPRPSSRHVKDDSQCFSAWQCYFHTFRMQCFNTLLNMGINTSCLRLKWRRLIAKIFTDRQLNIERIFARSILDSYSVKVLEGASILQHRKTSSNIACMSASKYAGLSSQQLPSGSHTRLSRRDLHTSWSISMKYFLSHIFSMSGSWKIIIPEYYNKELWCPCEISFYLPLSG